MEQEVINIGKFKKELGELYPLAQVIWAQICKEEFFITPTVSLGAREVPIDECTELEKILLACISYIEDEQEKAMLMQHLMLLMYQNHPIAKGVKIEIRKFFFIVVVS
ncbi:MAG: hypothetical protein NT085_04105 [candidate division SR1 bacterium]|nr:hypothetical protein [candidate division SR1 bacterium]